MGVVLYEMLVGHKPFNTSTSDINEVYEKVLRGRYALPLSVSRRAKDLLHQLLQVIISLLLYCIPILLLFVFIFQCLH